MRYYALKIRVEERDSTRFPNKSKWDEEHRNFFTDKGVAEAMRDNFRKAMMADASALEWQDVRDIMVAAGFVPKLDKDGNMRPAEEYYSDVLSRWGESL